MSKKLIAFSYYGGKFSHLNWLLPLLPDDCQTFVDVFGGSGAVILNRKPSPVDVYNDMNEEVVNFFRVLRSEPQELIEQLTLTPYSRQEFMESIEVPETMTNVERARRFFTCVSQCVGSQTGTSKGAHQWSYRIKTSCRGMASGVSAWLSKIDGMWDVVERLKTIQIEHKSAVDIIKRYDSQSTLFYCDPPYMRDTRNSGTNSYEYETVAGLHYELAYTLWNIEGRAALSGYRNQTMDYLYENWSRFDAPIKRTSGRVIQEGSGDNQSKRQESLWTNYPLPI